MSSPEAQPQDVEAQTIITSIRNARHCRRQLADALGDTPLLDVLGHHLRQAEEAAVRVRERELNRKEAETA